jgi:preprotein translocase SecF subunit
VTRLFAGASYGFTRQARKAYAASALLLLLGLGGALLNRFTIGSWQRYGADIGGGALVELRGDASLTEERVRSLTRGIADVEISAFGDGQRLLLRAAPADGEDVDAFRARLEERLATASGAGTVEIVSVESLGADAGLVGLRGAVLTALLVLALGGAYLVVRCGVLPGAAGVLAALHDLVALLGLTALLRVSVDAAVVAAVLAAFAYSLQDKAVVLDRVREHQTRKGQRRPDHAALVDRAVNETLPRTAFTAAATALLALALAVVGPAAVRGFAVVLVLGVLVATWSSLFLLGPLVLTLVGSRGPDPKKKARPQAAAAR